MAKKIDVILLEDVDGVGNAGDIVSVSEGYARNSLFGEGKAALADATAKTAAEKKAAKVKQVEDKQLQEAQELASTLEGTELSLSAKVKEGEGSELYGSITAATIAKELSSQTDLTIKAKDIGLPEPITATGSYDVAVQLADEIEATIKVLVVAENPEDAAKDEE